MAQSTDDDSVLQSTAALVPNTVGSPARINSQRVAHTARRARGDGGQEAGDGEALCGDHREGPYRGGAIESLLE